MGQRAVLDLLKKQYYPSFLVSDTYQKYIQSLELENPSASSDQRRGKYLVTQCYFNASTCTSYFNTPNFYQIAIIYYSKHQVFHIILCSLQLLEYKSEILNFTRVASPVLRT